MSRQMFTANPPVKLETDERQRADVLHASALAMAKRMYNQQQHMIETAKQAHARSSSFSRHNPGHEDHEQPPIFFNNLQEAAYRLAQERLAKLHDEHQKNRDFQEYYGSPGLPQRGKFGSIRNKLTRRRSSSDGDLLNDQQRSQQIRHQMSLFNTRLMEVDEQKRTRDREALLAAAQKNVKARLQDMDDALSLQNGRIQPSSTGDWERKAHAAAQARFDAARIESRRKIDIGGGKFMDKDEVEQIAARTVQPLLDEINQNAERERERKAALKAEEEKQKEEAERNKLREKEIQSIHRRLKEQQREDEKARKAEIKLEEKARKEEIKASKAEEKRSVKDGKQKEKQATPPPAPEQEAPQVDPAPEKPAAAKTKEHGTTGNVLTKTLPAFSKRKPKETKDRSISPPDFKKALNTGSTGNGVDSSPGQKVKSWLKTRFHRPRAKSSSAAGEHTFAKLSKTDTDANNTTAAKPFIGGVALARLHGRNVSTPTISHHTSSMQEVAMAGRERPLQRFPQEDEPGESSSSTKPPNFIYSPQPISAARARPQTPDSALGLVGKFEHLLGRRAVFQGSVSSLSSAGSVERFEEAVSHVDGPLTPPSRAQLFGEGSARLTPPQRRGSPLRESRFSENLD